VSEVGTEPQGAATFASAMAGATRYHRWVVSAFAPYVGRSVLEVGIGHGGFRRLLGAPTYVGADIDPDLIERARRADPGAEWLVADVADDGFPRLIGGARFDTVLCVNVLEHVREQEAGLRNMMSALVPGGRLLLFVPAFKSLYTDLDRLAGHVRRYRVPEVRALLQRVGAEVLMVEYFNPVGAVGWFLNRFLSHQSLESRQVQGQVQFFDRYVLPVSRMLNPVTHRFFGQSVIAAGRKPAS
jgi:SAM-dependent methyltransferase